MANVRVAQWKQRAPASRDITPTRRRFDSCLAFLLLLSAPAYAETLTLPAPGKALATVQSDETGSQWQVFAVDFDRKQLASVTPRTFDDGKLSLCIIEGTPGIQCGVMRFSADGKQRETLVLTLGGGSPLPVPPPGPDDPKPIPPAPTVKVTAVSYIYEKDTTGVPAQVMSGLNRVNREKNLLATLHEIDTTDGTNQVPDQYKAAVVAAKEAGLPALVVTAGSVVLKVVKNPKTVEDVWSAVP